MRPLSPAEQSRFRSKFVEGAPGQCWVWTGAYSTDGAPRFTRERLPQDKRARDVTATHVMFEMRCGRLPDRANVKSSCGNRGCLNPKHLIVDGGQDAPEPAAPLPSVAPQQVALALPDALLSHLDQLDASQVPALRTEVDRLKARLRTLEIVISLAQDRPAPPAARPPQPRKPAPVKGTRGAPPASANIVLVRRLAYYLASADRPVGIDALATAMAVKRATVVRAAAGPWFVRTGDTVTVTDAGRAVALEGRP